MQEFETPNEQFVRDFNNGYTIASNNPALAKKLLSVELGTTRSGLRGGIQQCFKELEKDNKPSWLKSKASKEEKTKTQEKDRGLDRD